jgi:hypothetical protein
MDWRKFVIALVCIAAAFVLFFKHIDGGGSFLTLLGGSPLAAEAGKKLFGTTPPASDPPSPDADPAHG